MASVTQVRVNRVGDPPSFPELGPKVQVNCNLDRIVVLQKGTDGGRSSILINVDLPDGTTASIQTTARNFETIANIIRGACQSWGEDITQG